MKPFSARIYINVSIYVIFDVVRFIKIQDNGYKREIQGILNQWLDNELSGGPEKRPLRQYILLLSIVI